MNPLVKRSTTRKEAGSEPIGFEVVPAESEDAIATAIHDELLNRDRKDDRMYDSDDEDYDNHDKIRTLALGTMMLRHSKKKALVDASYNRFAWNDPKELPSWFLDDEMRHNKPQLPIPTALLEQVSSDHIYASHDSFSPSLSLSCLLPSLVYHIISYYYYE